MCDEIIKQLRERLKEAVKKNPAEALLFSGGLDSSILAFFCPGIKAVTVSLNFFGEDLKYAKLLVKSCSIEHYHKKIEIEEGICAIPEVIRILKSFDPAIPNDITCYFGLQFARDMGIKTVMTGDGADELFAGYSYMQDISNLASYIRRMSLSMTFSSNILGRFFDLQVKQPYLDEEFVDFSLKIPVESKLRQDKKAFIGKWILRKTFEKILPDGTIWQAKRPLEVGSGTSKLREIIASKINDDEFRQAKNVYRVKFISKEHYYYYKMYRKEVGEIPGALPGEQVCPGCGTGLRKQSRHCKICGWTKKL